MGTRLKYPIFFFYLGSFGAAAWKGDFTLKAFHHKGKN
jgi:hypothetical protein